MGCLGPEAFKSRHGGSRRQVTLPSAATAFRSRTLLSRKNSAGTRRLRMWANNCSSAGFDCHRRRSDSFGRAPKAAARKILTRGRGLRTVIVGGRRSEGGSSFTMAERPMRRAPVSPLQVWHQREKVNSSCRTPSRALTCSGDMSGGCRVSDRAARPTRVKLGSDGIKPQTDANSSTRRKTHSSSAP